MEWIKRGEIYGAGEILLTSIDRDGTGRGFDLDLIKLATESVIYPCNCKWRYWYQFKIFIRQLLMLILMP